MQHHRPVYDITPFTVLDYPEHLAAIIWFAKCNIRCDYCYNPDIVFSEGKISEDEVFAFLKKRVGMLEAVVLSGGEATLYKNIVEFSKQIKDLGFKIKLDTNGLKPAVLKELISLKLIDYVALDYKAPKGKFEFITKSTYYEKFEDSLNFLLASDVEFEVRTTVHTDLLDEDDINEIIKDLKSKNYKANYYLQAYLHTDKTLGNIKGPSREFSKAKLLDILPIVWR